MSKRFLSIILSAVLVLYVSATVLGESVSSNGVYPDEEQTIQEVVDSESEETVTGEDGESGQTGVDPQEEVTVSEDEIIPQKDNESDDVADESEESDAADDGEDTRADEETEDTEYTDDTETIEDPDDTEYDDNTVIEDNADDTEETIQVEEEITEEEWLSEHEITETDDGSLEYTDENGEHWEFAPEDPEIFRHVKDTGVGGGVEITLKPDKNRSLTALKKGKDPYSLILNPDFKYRYPGFFKSGDTKELPDVHCGMDISRYQGVISLKDWKTLKNDYGIEFVFIRAGYRGYGAGGSLNEDICCRKNIKNAYKAGVAVGVYYFSQAISEEEAVDEAEHCLEIIDGCEDMISLPVVTNYEYSGAMGRLRRAGLSADEHTAIVNAFCERVKEEGYTSGIYANKSMLQKDMKLDDIPEDHFIWMANFVSNGKNGVYSTSYTGALSAWQFTSRFTGFGEGRNGLGLMKSVNLDLDLWYGDLPGEDEDEPEQDVKTVSVNYTRVAAKKPEKKTSKTVISDTEADGDGKADQIEEKEAVKTDYMCINNTVMTATDVKYSPRPRACRSTVRIYNHDGARLVAGLDYDRNLTYTYEKETIVKQRMDLWGRRYREVTVEAGDPVDLKRDIIPEGTVIRVTAKGKGRYKATEESDNIVSTTFCVASKS
ncbi:MAG: hypothetical protein IJ641_08640 [Lachnospiraceae bacterium]|nr:hypothetical protein [Lachnospiraceae bacterium]